MLQLTNNMNLSKGIVFSLFFVAFALFLPISEAHADGGRYLVKSTKGFWKNTFGVRHVFDSGFTADLSDFQIRLAKVFGVEIEAVPVFQILPGDASSIPVPDVSDVRVKKNVSRIVPSDQTPWGVELVYNDPDLVSTSGGAGVNIAILDTGVNSSHPDLKNRIAKCKDFSSARNPIVDGKCDDKNGHGTHVAGIIAADSGADAKGIYGIAPESNLFVYKVCGADGSCSADDIAAALNVAVADGANIVNMSFGSDRESLLIKNAVSFASDKGLLLIAAAGNDGPFADSIDYPASYSSVISVGALNVLLDTPEWSSRGSNSKTIPGLVENRDMEFAAPGERIESTWINGGYALLSGTSMATPFISGLAAKYWLVDEENPSVATRELMRYITIDVGLEGEDDATGFGLPQVE